MELLDVKLYLNEKNRMGRTKRKRRKLEKANTSTNKAIINLQKWLSKNHWKNNTKLKIKSFVPTGRGITSKKSISPNDILISIPANLMITYRNINTNIPIKDKLAMQEFLAFFLIIEKNKGAESKWLEYIQSLPEEVPPLPWLASPGEFNEFPDDLRLAAAKNISLFKEFLFKVERSITDANSVLCKWAYAMVNTRGVYVDPNLISNESSRELLLDEPSMALCPFLDMFNHHYLANTEANLVQDGGELVYQLKTLAGFKKKKQIFISYGQHDNVKLLNEYGFFMPGNIYDTLIFKFEDVLKVLGFNLDQNRYKFIKDHNFHENLYIGYDGVSYNLKILLFVGCSEGFRHLYSTVFSDGYPVNFLEFQLPKFMETMLNFKSEMFAGELLTITNSDILSDIGKNVVEFVKYRLGFVEELKRILI